MMKKLVSLFVIGLFSVNAHASGDAHDVDAIPSKYSKHEKAPAHKATPMKVAKAETHNTHTKAMQHTKSSHSIKRSSHGGSVHWGYEGAQGPDNWGRLSDAYALCGEGLNQSPIDIQASADRDLDSITFHYNASPVRAINNGHTIQMNYAPGSYIEIGGRQYDLLQFHFHTPSEHTVNNEPTEMEVHFVHKSDDGHLAVVGVMIKAGIPNREFLDLWRILPTEVNQEAYADGKMLNAADLLPESHAYYHYRGSLTTPPCSEGVNWFVMQEPVTLSPAAVAKFYSVVGNNARPVQKLHARVPMRMDR